ncbi:mediator of RNA polymerase II transcription subunit 8 [Staphylotrichum tortipilum]|uniref:Mediator of RNA polymerase II transcription subunit 8 n=1 Tax=Staphylotrichum tortipilum TaxID=2831512 RepID=A0AAN6MQT8_9PEZI|nr:mediator of RNA polymerase II transcription subunit 8 [Staphylotrichum longicolle]
MASLNMAPEELKQLELLRSRFSQLTRSIQSLRQSVLNSNPLPSRDSLQASVAILQQNIRTLQELATENAGLFQRLAVHPSTNFPGRTQEHILLSLLRKKLEPDVESWVEEARETAHVAGLDASKLSAGMRERGEHDYDDEDTYGMDEDDAPSDPFTEQWADMHDIFMQSLQQYVTVQVKKKYTVEEQAMGVENVRTGLRQPLVDSDDEEDEDEEEDEAEEQAVPAAAGAGAPPATDGKQAVEPEYLFCLMARGDLRLTPRDFPFESRPAPARPTGRPAPPR